MREYIALADTLNFSQTAYGLFITQPALSRHIAEIETAVGTKLIRRSPHDVALMPVGRVVLEEFREIVRQYDALIETQRALSGGFTGELRMGILNYDVEAYISPALERFKEILPNIKLSLTTCRPAQLEDDLITGKTDVALLVRKNSESPDIFVHYNIRRAGLAAAVSSKHRLADRKSIQAAELAGEHLVLLKDSDNYNNVIRELLTAHGIHIARHTFADDIDTVSFALHETGGVYIGPRHLSALPWHSVAWVNVEDKAFQYDMAFVYRADNKNPAIPHFIDCADQIFA
jgi:LysR family hydrogen peroxide-inducible transcriptional activator